MKNEILKILSVYGGHMFQDDFFDGDTLYLIGERQETIEQLLQLMCYREVRAIIEWIGIDYLMEYEESVVEQLGKTYDSDIVWDAIEQVKNEMK